MLIQFSPMPISKRVMKRRTTVIGNSSLSSASTKSGSDQKTVLTVNPAKTRVPRRWRKRRAFAVLVVFRALILPRRNDELPGLVAHDCRSFELRVSPGSIPRAQAVTCAPPIPLHGKNSMTAKRIDGKAKAEQLAESIAEHTAARSG